MQRITDHKITVKGIEAALDSCTPEFIGRIAGGLSLTAMHNCLTGGNMCPSEQLEIRALTGFYAPIDSFQQEMREYGKLELDALRKSTICLRNDIDESATEVIHRLESLVDGYVDSVHVWSSCHTPSWVPLLEGRKVLVVSAFAETMKQQWPKRHLLHTTNPSSTLNFKFPEFDVSFVKAPLTLTGCEPFKHKSWHSAYAELCDEVDKQSFDVALLSCGAYAQPLGGHIFDQGGKSWCVGGILQTVFGIRGHRWSRITSNVSNSYNEHWTKPSESETPRNFRECRPDWDIFWEVDS